MTLIFENATKYYQKKSTKKYILNNVSLKIHTTEKVAIICTQNKHSRVVLDMIALRLRANSGQVKRFGRFSTILGDTSDFHHQLSGEEYVKFKCKLYGADFILCKNYVRNFSEINNKKFLTKSKNYDGFTRKKIAYGTELFLNFDTYLIDGSVGFGPKPFQEKSIDEFTISTKNSGIIISTNSLPVVDKFAEKILLLNNGESILFDDKPEGIIAFKSLKEETRPQNDTK